MTDDGIAITVTGVDYVETGESGWASQAWDLRSLSPPKHMIIGAGSRGTAPGAICLLPDKNRDRRGSQEAECHLHHPHRNAALHAFLVVHADANVIMVGRCSL